MELIPVLPCSNADELISFYKSLGFELIGKYIRSYVVLKYDNIVLHFYATKHIKSEENSCMCIVKVPNLEQLHSKFEMGIKAFFGEIKRTGFPRITKIRNLSDDIRFTLTDPSGNTFYMLTPKFAGQNNFFRDLDDSNYGQKFAVLYDLVYSKEDYKVAGNLLPKLLEIKDKLSDLNKIKLLLIALEIGKDNDRITLEQEIRTLMTNILVNDEYQLIEQRLNEILS